MKMNLSLMLCASVFALGANAQGSYTVSHMRELYAKYHDRGLDFVYVSDDDSNPDKWRKAVADDQLTESLL